MEQVKRITSYDEINEMFDTNYDPRPFTDFETHLFNGDIKNIDINNYLNDIEHIYSLANYFNIHKDSINYLKCTNILLQKGDTRGYNKLGSYLLDKNKTEDAIKVFSVGAEKGNLNCIANLGVMYARNRDFDNALKYFLCSYEKGNNHIISAIVSMYIRKNDPSNALKLIVIGLSKEDARCMEILEMIFDRTELYWFLCKLKFTNQFVKNKIQELHKCMTIKEIERNVTQDLIIKTDCGVLLNSDFELIFDFKEFPSVDIQCIHTVEDIFKILLDELVKMPTNDIENV